jgi:hypothetical protein
MASTMASPDDEPVLELVSGSIVDGKSSVQLEAMEIDEKSIDLDESR